MYLAIQKRYERETHSDTHGNTQTDTQGNTQTDTQGDTQTDTHADTILKLNQTKLNSRKENHQRKEAMVITYLLMPLSITD